MFVLNTNFHFVEAVADVGRVQFIDSNGLRVVGLNCDNNDSAMAIVRLQLLDALLIHLRDRAMVAGEYYNQYGTGRVISETMDLSIHAGQGEIRRRRAQRQNRVGRLPPSRESQQQRENHSPHRYRTSIPVFTKEQPLS
jgi:hypothetical protein